MSYNRCRVGDRFRSSLMTPIRLRVRRFRCFSCQRPVSGRRRTSVLSSNGARSKPAAARLWPSTSRARQPTTNAYIMSCNVRFLSSWVETMQDDDRYTPSINTPRRKSKCPTRIAGVIIMCYNRTTHAFLGRIQVGTSKYDEAARTNFKYVYVQSWNGSERDMAYTYIRLDYR